MRRDVVVVVVMTTAIVEIVVRPAWGNHTAAISWLSGGCCG